MIKLEWLDAQIEGASHTRTKKRLIRIKEGLVNIAINPSLHQTVKSVKGTMIQIEYTRNVVILPQKTKHSLFGKSAGTEEIIQYYLNRIHPGNNLDHKGASRYQISKELRDYVDAILKEQVEIVRNGGKSTLPNDKESIEPDVISNVTIDQAVFNAVLVDTLDNGNRRDMVELINLTRDVTDGTYQIKYHNDSHGRFNVGLQNVTKGTRKKLFSGWYDYDIESSLPTMFYHMAQLHGLDLNATKVYIDNKTQVRNEIASQLNLSKEQTKKCLTIIYYNSTLPTDVQLDNYHSISFDLAIVQTIGVEKTRKLIRNETFLELVNELRDATKTILEPLRDEKVITNVSGFEYNVDKWNSFKVMAHLYYGYERLVMDCVKDIVGLDDKFYIHDGFISKQKLDTDKLSEAVNQKLDIKVRFSHLEL